MITLSFFSLFVVFFWNVHLINKYHNEFNCKWNKKGAHFLFNRYKIWYDFFSISFLGCLALSLWVCQVWFTENKWTKIGPDKRFIRCWMKFIRHLMDVCTKNKNYGHFLNRRKNSNCVRWIKYHAQANRTLIEMVAWYTHTGIVFM